MVEEVLRRLRNCDPDAEWNERGRHLTEFAVSMRSSGHSEHFPKIVFQKAVARFRKEFENHCSGAADLYRSREERRRQCEERGGKSTKDSWFRQGEGSERVTAVMKVPFTPDSQLRDRLKISYAKLRAPTGISTKIQEEGGSKLKFELMKSDPFPRSQCHRTCCPLKSLEGGCKERCF